MKVSKLVKSLENTEYHSRIGANFFTFVYAGSNPAELEKRIKDQLNLLIIDNYKPKFYVTFLSSSGIKNAEEMVYLLQMQIEGMKVTLYKNQ